MRKLWAIVNVVLVVGYPFAAYWGLTRWTARGVGVLLLALLLPRVGLLLRSARRADRVAVLRLPLMVAALVAVAALLNDSHLLLALPVLINGTLLLSFGRSLYSTPMIERFARLQDPELTPDRVRYCRKVTVVWCGFFVLNGLVCALLALFGPLALWTLYTGVLAYVGIACLGAAEYVFRKYRFREYSDAFHDRLLARLFPPLTSSDAQ